MQKPYREYNVMFGLIFSIGQKSTAYLPDKMYLSTKNTICATISFLHVIFYAYRAVKQSFCLAIENQYKDAALL